MTHWVESFVFLNQHKVWTQELLLEEFLTLIIWFCFNKQLSMEPGSILQRSCYWLSALWVWNGLKNVMVLFVSVCCIIRKSHTQHLTFDAGSIISVIHWGPESGKEKHNKSHIIWSLSGIVNRETTLLTSLGCTQKQGYISHMNIDLRSYYRYKLPMASHKIEGTCSWLHCIHIQQ
jgi:hypothetical protein